MSESSGAVVTPYTDSASRRGWGATLVGTVAQGECPRGGGTRRSRPEGVVGAGPRFCLVGRRAKGSGGWEICWEICLGSGAEKSVSAGRSAGGNATAVASANRCAGRSPEHQISRAVHPIHVGGTSHSPRRQPRGRCSVSLCPSDGEPRPVPGTSTSWGVSKRGRIHDGVGPRRKCVGGGVPVFGEKRL